jgi:hypothetical protein
MFTAASLKTMDADKPMWGNARVNRFFGEKPGGTLNAKRRTSKDSSGEGFG